MNRTILLVDDDAEVLRMLGRFFENKGWVVQRAAEVNGAMDLYERDRPDLVLLDVGLPGVSGLRFLEVLRTRDADAAVIVLTGQADIETAVEAMRLGAENFLTKPVELGHLEIASERAFEKAELRRRNRFFAERQSDAGSTDALGRTPFMREIARQIELLADSDTTVLLSGETGTGKGFVAQLLHSLSGRSSSPFIEINSAGLSPTFLDSEMFGHEKGAFTDAKEQKRGLLELAHGGTFFLDEVGDLSLDLQPKLLKVLERQRFRRVGGVREIEVDVRLVAATNIDLERAVRAGRFREDLYYRLNVLPLRLPPLRERGREEIADLAIRTLLNLRRRLGRGPSRLSADALETLVQYSWPGNIREMRNVLERVLLLSAGVEEIQPGHLPAEIVGNGLGLGGGPEDTLSLQEVERRHIARVLAHHGGNRSRTARTLGISRATLYEKLSRYELNQIGR
ncbi:MAG TPA: sigma-54 dependent transcriptional regulator [Longimicrobiales bacterium]|nr:sigma-54 dependent transcriptional regulator [Longimicrobiales bacterium]